MKAELDLAEPSRDYGQSAKLSWAGGLGVTEFLAQNFSQLVYLWASIVLLGANANELPIEQLFFSVALLVIRYYRIHVLAKPSAEDLWSYSILALFGLVIDVLSLVVGCTGLTTIILKNLDEVQGKGNDKQFRLSLFLLVFYSLSLLETFIYFVARGTLLCKILYYLRSLHKLWLKHQIIDAEDKEGNLQVNFQFNVQLTNAVTFLEIYRLHHTKPAYYDILDKETVCISNIMALSEGAEKRWSLPSLTASATRKFTRIPVIRKFIVKPDFLEFVYKRYNNPVTWLQSLRICCTGLADEYEERINYVSRNKPLVKRIFEVLLTWESSLEIRQSTVGLLLGLCKNKQAAYKIAQAVASDDRRLQVLIDALPPCPYNELNSLLQKLVDDLTGESRELQYISNKIKSKFQTPLSVSDIRI